MARVNPCPLIKNKSNCTTTKKGSCNLPAITICYCNCNLLLFDRTTTNGHEVPPLSVERLHQHHGHHKTFAARRHARRLDHRPDAGGRARRCHDGSRRWLASRGPSLIE